MNYRFVRDQIEDISLNYNNSGLEKYDTDWKYLGKKITIFKK